MSARYTIGQRVKIRIGTNTTAEYTYLTGIVIDSDCVRVGELPDVKEHCFYTIRLDIGGNVRKSLPEGVLEPED